MTNGPALRARAIAFYLPQFYPTPENDAWWGPGFTEWTNVAQARPLFEGHYQPHLPAELGFYDLRLPEVREQQAELAAQHGIEAFCYWHYWFLGRRMLGRPFEEVLAGGRPDFPFCLSWANETWSRRWHGTGDATEVLIQQTYSEADDLAHARWLAAAFADPRYVTINGRPLFVVYRPFDLPDPQRTTDTFRREISRLGLAEPYLIGINAHNPTNDTRPLGFDTTLNFEPQLSALPNLSKAGLKVADYAWVTSRMRLRPRDYPFHPAVIVGWDNTPRRGSEGIVFTGATPQAFGAGLSAILDGIGDQPFEQRLIFLNAWNEWAEGNYLEPDLRFGHAYLEAVRSELGRQRPGGKRRSPAQDEIHARDDRPERQDRPARPRPPQPLTAIAADPPDLGGEVASGDAAALDAAIRSLPDAPLCRHVSHWRVEDFGALFLRDPGAYPHLARRLPRMPSEDIQRTWTWYAGQDAIDDAVRFAVGVRQMYAILASRPLEQATILDYGAGWGRHTRMFYQVVPESQVHACDASAEVVSVFDSLGFARPCVKVDPSPSALPFAPATFDFVILVSVLTHLPPQVAERVMSALRGIVRDDGFVMLTIRPVEFWNRNPLVRDKPKAREMPSIHLQSGTAHLSSRPGWGDTSISPEWIARRMRDWSIVDVVRAHTDQVQVWLRPA